MVNPYQQNERSLGYRTVPLGSLQASLKYSILKNAIELQLDEEEMAAIGQLHSKFVDFYKYLSQTMNDASLLMNSCLRVCCILQDPNLDLPASVVINAAFEPLFNPPLMVRARRNAARPPAIVVDLPQRKLDAARQFITELLEQPLNLCRNIFIACKNSHANLVLLDDTKRIMKLGSILLHHGNPELFNQKGAWFGNVSHAIQQISTAYESNLTLYVTVTLPALLLSRYNQEFPLAIEDFQMEHRFLRMLQYTWTVQSTIKLCPMHQKVRNYSVLLSADEICYSMFSPTAINAIQNPPFRNSFMLIIRKIDDQNTNCSLG